MVLRKIMPRSAPKSRQTPSDRADTLPQTFALPAERARLTPTALKAVKNLAAAWRLTGDDAAVLVGVSPSTWDRISAAGCETNSSQDQLTRISALVGIFKGLHLLFADDMADRWPKLANSGPLFRESYADRGHAAGRHSAHAQPPPAHRRAARRASTSDGGDAGGAAPPPTPTSRSRVSLSNGRCVSSRPRGSAIQSSSRLSTPTISMRWQRSKAPLRAPAGQARGGARIGPKEFVAGPAHANFINAAFAYWRPRELNRFNGPGRGAWYAALAVETCIAEVSFHLVRELQRVNDFNAAVEYAELFASFAGDFLDLRNARPAPLCLHPDPAIGYPPGNALADTVRSHGANGIVYPSVRHTGGTCLVALWPQAVQSVVQGGVIRLAWRGMSEPEVNRL